MRASGFCSMLRAQAGERRGAARVKKRKRHKADLEQFFEPFDPERKGKVSRKVFRNLMENVGEPFSRAEASSICVRSSIVKYSTI